MPQRRISVFLLFIVSLYADIHKLMSSVDMEILSSYDLINQFYRKEKSSTVRCHHYLHDKKVNGHR